MRRGITALQMDFQRRPHGGQPRLGWVLLVLGALILAGAYAEHVQLESALAASRAEQARQAVKKLTASSPADARETAQAAKAAHAVRAQLAAPWGRMFAEVEGAVHEDIALLTLHADPAARALRMSGEARNFGALMDYVRRLEASPMLAEVRLSGHEVRQQDPRRPVAFALSASWAAAP
jgi:Tfp pilus assembly protein PilN